MSEHTMTIRYGEHLGYTFHYDRGKVVTWSNHSAECHDMAEHKD